MSSPSSTVAHSSARGAKRGKLLVVALFLVALAAASGFWFMRQRAGSAAALTTPEITEIAKKTPAEDRAAWLRLARATLAAEAVRKLAPPEEPVNNRGESSRVELGYRLFFDPILSGDKNTSCASCHHPQYGMADGLQRGVGVGGRGYGAQRAGTGRELLRNTPSVFNVAYNPILFWDGRAGSLEEQVIGPLFSEEEMNQTSAAELLRRLRAIPEYREMFGRAFGLNSKLDGAEITLPNIAQAIAAFERKLNIADTAYDRFVKGEDDRLTTEQLRGMVVFFGQGQCAVCHTPPKFHDDVLSSIGTPASAEKGAPHDSDPGFGAVIRRQDGFGMFKTPGLRNIERTAPYMHNGAFKTLEEVIDFYNDGGGRGRGLEVPSQDTKVQKLDLSDQQKRDLVAFLKSLNDLGPPPVVPDRVPSGLSVVGK